MLEVVSYKMLKTMENSDKAVILKMVAVAYKRWTFTRGSNFKALSGEILVFLLGGHTWTFDGIFSLGSRVIEISTQQLLCRIR